MYRDVQLIECYYPTDSWVMRLLLLTVLVLAVSEWVLATNLVIEPGVDPDATIDSIIDCGLPPPLLGFDSNGNHFPVESEFINTFPGRQQPSIPTMITLLNELGTDLNLAAQAVFQLPVTTNPEMTSPVCTWEHCYYYYWR